MPKPSQYQWIVNPKTKDGGFVRRLSQIDFDENAEVMCFYLKSYENISNWQRKEY